MNQSTLLDYIKEHPNCSSKQISEVFADEVSLSTVKRMLGELVDNYYVTVQGKARATRYTASSFLLFEFFINYYFG